MGVSCAGKTSVGLKLANSLGIYFIDADDYHCATNIEKMQNGTPLNDADRKPWLNNLNKELLKAIMNGKSIVLACSALKDSYRKRLLRNIQDYLIIYLRADTSILRKRQGKRKNHFFKPTLLESQIEILEPPKEKYIELDSNASIHSILENILHKLKNSS